jgi:DNA-binding LytR/AlgR family response regulator
MIAHSYTVALDKRTDEQLVEILYFEKNKYKHQVILEVKKILVSRKISDELQKKLRRKIKKRRRIYALEQRKENTRFGVVEFVIELILGLINAIH